jgi:SAM-dependent methyltransferase
VNYPNPVFNPNPDRNPEVQRKDWYSPIAIAYDRVRPRYPQQLLDRLAVLPDRARILEIGCGTGIATVALAELGYSIVAVEASLEMCTVARRNCAAYPQVEIHHALFEDWELTAGKFDAVVAATSWHWVSPDVAYAKAADALTDNGLLILLWNVVPQPDDDIFQLLEPVYQTHAPALADRLALTTYSEQLRGFQRQITDSGYFQGSIASQMEYQIVYAIDDYLLLLTTLSPYIQLPITQQRSLCLGLKEVLSQNCLDGVVLTHLAAIQMAKKLRSSMTQDVDRFAI